MAKTYKQLMEEARQEIPEVSIDEVKNRMERGENWTLLRKKFGAITWDKAPGFAQWKKEVEEARARGWSVDRDNFMSGITVVAVPIFAPSGRLTHTLVAVGLSSQLHASATAELAAAMRREAQAIADLLLDRV